jgi:uncharacterized membrane protein YdjX (TVP38/TMEM64 family)
MGIVRYPPLTFLIVAIASELPAAVWVVYLSAALIGDERVAFLLTLVAGFAVVGFFTYRLLGHSGRTSHTDG